MKLRRTMAAAAITAVIAPAALLAAPSAFATDEPAVSASPSATESTEPAPSTSAPTEPGTEPSQSESSETTTAPAPSTSAPSATSDAVESEEQKPGDEDAEETEEPAEGERPWECPVDGNDEEIIGVNDALTTTLTNLPDTVVAGTGWKNFQLQMNNSGDSDIKGVAPFVAVYSADEENAYLDGFTLEVKDSSGAWKVVADSIGAGGYFTQVDLKAGQKLTIDLRFKVDGQVPDSLGIAIGAGEYSTEDGGCWVSVDPNEYVYFFDILEAGSKLPGKPNDAKPQTGGKTPVKVDKVSEVKDVTGNLAQTGSDSNLPVIGLIGGITVVAGAGVVFAVKRRRGVEA
ncbi:LPXTG cell wall anchor domain-containing protein [Streptomyces sp. TRM66268-LWL]|uniref:LPXTG cell wall anchor domain-containing protein n=1 Tax=Streptomyces polyasparticus TaxID=2767826 RepID=A0ABR7SRR6_9ACTN|nr:LPXTG cell wall anchor domain-containing protein [Streptomyces polyasparticus]MBC9717282.1 LPXTG cell wall anchor domain-containing protein [Streptomyces polyasparticus]